MRSVISSRRGSPLWLNWINWLLTRISVSVFLKLWATPAAMVPMASIFWTCWSCISRRLRSVMSVSISITVRLVALHRQLLDEDLPAVQLERLVLAGLGRQARSAGEERRKPLPDHPPRTRSGADSAVSICLRRDAEHGHGGGVGVDDLARVDLEDAFRHALEDRSPGAGCARAAPG